MKKKSEMKAPAPLDADLYDSFLELAEDVPVKVRQELATFASISPLAKKLALRLDLKIFIGKRVWEKFDRPGITKECTMLVKADNDALFMAGMRTVKYRELFGIMIRDTMLGQNIDDTLSQLSDLADIIITSVSDYVSRSYFAHISPGLSAIAMGKLGACELNFSSDVDLIYIYPDSDIEDVDQYSKWAVKVNQLLTANTEDGFLYRVDNDLRPGGRFSHLAMSGNAMINHYFVYGETWQRVALLRSRFLFGDSSFVDEVVGELMPYIYRKYLDYSMVSDLRELKVKINTESRKRDKEGVNVKLGKGGIREAEFFVQVLQIMNGGRNLKLRKVRIPDAIDALVSEHVIDESEGKGLKEAYRFLRKTENAIQMEEEEQAYLLPQDNRQIERVARRTGFTDTRQFLDQLEWHREFVHRLFNDLFGEKTGAVQEVSAAETLECEKLVALLMPLDWEDETRVEEYVRTFAELGEKSPVRYRRNYSIFLLELFRKLSQKGRQLKTLAALEDFIKVLIKKPIYFSLLAENPGVVELLITVFSFGPFLSRILVSHPETLDFIVAKDSIDRPSLRSYYETITELLEGSDDFEDKMQLIRQFKNSEWLKTGLKNSTGTISQREMENYLTNLAEASLMAVTDLCEAQLAARMGPVKQEFAILGMGKLGTGEMNYFSDLDLIFIFRSSDERAGLYNTRLLQRIISALTTATREGELYTVDMRLRPTGNQGPLVTSFDSFRNYHKDSWLFEKQALTKARVLGFSSSFGKEITDAVDKILYGRKFQDKVLKKEIGAMRDRMENEISQKEKADDLFDIKAGKGGLVDIEFIVQYLKLKYGSRYTELRVTNTYEFFEKFRSTNILDDAVIDRLVSADDFLKRLESRLRLVSGYSRDSVFNDDEAVEELMFSLGYRKSSRETFLADLKKTKTQIRDLFNLILGRSIKV